jgi:hypothetical protein
MCMLNGIQIWPRDAILHIFQGNPRELPLYVSIQYVQQFVCENMNYVMHMIEELQQIILEKYMLCLPKPGSLVLVL